MNTWKFGTKSSSVLRTFSIAVVIKFVNHCSQLVVSHVLTKFPVTCHHNNQRNDTVSVLLIVNFTQCNDTASVLLTINFTQRNDTVSVHLTITFTQRNDTVSVRLIINFTHQQPQLNSTLLALVQGGPKSRLFLSSCKFSTKSSQTFTSKALLCASAVFTTICAASHTLQ